MIRCGLYESFVVTLMYHMVWTYHKLITIRLSFDKKSRVLCQLRRAYPLILIIWRWTINFWHRERVRMSWLYPKHEVSANSPQHISGRFYRTLARVPSVKPPVYSPIKRGSCWKVWQQEIGGQPIFSQIRVRKNESWPRTEHYFRYL